MADDARLSAAKTAKNDESYTRWQDIEAEMNAYVAHGPDAFRGKTVLLPCDDPERSEFTRWFAANFERLGLKKLISTSYAKGAWNRQIALFEQQSPLFDPEKHDARGKLFTLTRDVDGSGRIDGDDLELMGYLEGDGDFRSAEVRALRDEADVIVTNPPFSLFRDFLAWILEANEEVHHHRGPKCDHVQRGLPLVEGRRDMARARVRRGQRVFLRRARRGPRVRVGRL
ncbi:MAG: hypothetical protein IJR14_05900 [Synergistaceae bacterium]|nr:hypothetical protein [Synergistaceae bacterium]